MGCSPIRVLLQTDNSDLRRLPWNRCHLLASAEVGLSAPEYDCKNKPNPPARKNKVRILGVLGYATDLPHQGEEQWVLDELTKNAGGEIVWKEQPALDELNQLLSEQCWDILFFSGHSQSNQEGKRCEIQLTETHRLSVTEIKDSLKKAMAGGLRLAIFNSCDGLGLAHQLAAEPDLYLPQVIVMREKVPDAVSPKFLEFFLSAFTAGDSLYASMWEARRLLREECDKDYPCASWMPVICQNPAIEPATWLQLLGIPPCPYRGLSAFREADAPFFFGRENFAKQLLEAGRKNALVPVIGASGLGESSVVFAGLIPLLRQWDSSEMPVRIVSFRPGKDPFAALAVALAELGRLGQVTAASPSPPQPPSPTRGEGGERGWSESGFSGSGKSLNPATPASDSRQFLPEESGEVNRRLAELELETELRHSDRGLQDIIEALVAGEPHPPTPLPAGGEGGNRRVYSGGEGGKVIERIAPETRLVLVADALRAHGRCRLQFEELYTLTEDEPVRRRFLDSLLRAVNSAPRFTLVLTLRADFFPAAIAYPPFAEALKQCELQFLSQMSREELQEAIEKPAAKMKVRLEEELAKRLIDAVWEQSGHLPLLEFALTQLWERQANQTLTHKAYAEIGGVEEALANYAESVYAQLSEGERKKAEKVFIQLVRPGAGTKDTRRVVTGADLNEENWDLVRRLADARLVVTDSNQKTGEETVEMVHEALIEHWGRLRRWVGASREFRTWQDGLQPAIAQWESRDRDNRALLGGVALDVAEDWLLQRGEELSERERVFVERSLELRDRLRQEEEERRRRELEQERKARRAAQTAAGVGVVSVAIVSALALIANNQRLEAEVREKAARVQNVLSGNPLDGLVLAIQAAGESQSKLGQVLSPVQSSLLTAIQTPTEENFFQGHQDSVISVAFSPDGQYIVSGSADNTVRLWNLKGEPVGQPFRGHEDYVSSVAFSPDGQYIVSGSADKTVRLWNRKGEPVGQPFRGHEDYVSSVALSPDGQFIVSGSGDKTVRLWNRKGEPVGQPFRGHQSWVFSVAFSPDGQLIVSGSSDKTVRLWNRKGEPVGQPFQGHQGSVESVAFSPDGQLIVSGSSDKTVRLWNLKGEPVGQPFQGHQDSVNSVAFSLDGQYIVSGSRDSTVRLWNLKGEPVGQPFQVYQGEVSSVAFSPDGQYIVSGSRDGAVRLWRADNWNILLQVGCHRLRYHPVLKNPQTDVAKGARETCEKYGWRGQ
jgi:WD40 repeat protein